MPLFKLRKKNDSVEHATLIPAKKITLDFEKHLESWLEGYPAAIAQEPLLIIGRQVSAGQAETTTVFPDLLGLDKGGNLVVIELKKGRTPREVVAQLLEYAAWANDLSDEDISEISGSYFRSIENDQSLGEAFLETFETEEVPALNERLRLFIAAEEISPSVAKVCRFLRQAHAVDVNCIEFSVFQTESGEVMVNSEAYVGKEDVVRPKRTAGPRWGGDKPVKQVVWESVQVFTGGDKNVVFSPKEIAALILEKYPEFNKSSIRCQITSDCVNHTSRHHYPGGDDCYWLVERGRFKLFDSLTDL